MYIVLQNDADASQVSKMIEYKNLREFVNNFEIVYNLPFQEFETTYYELFDTLHFESNW